MIGHCLQLKAFSGHPVWNNWFSANLRLGHYIGKPSVNCAATISKANVHSQNQHVPADWTSITLEALQGKFSIGFLYLSITFKSDTFQVAWLVSPESRSLCCKFATPGSIRSLILFVIWLSGNKY